jgi:hypothetical protein
MTIEERIRRRKRRINAALKYQRWWLDKKARVTADPHAPFRSVVAIEWQGDDYGIVGNVILTWEDGTRSLVPTIFPAPRRTDLKIEGEENLPQQGKRPRGRPRTKTV